MANNNKVLYEYILNCKEYTEDPYWKEIIFSCSCNKFPRGMTYNNTKKTLYVRSDVSSTKQRTTLLTLSNTNTKMCFETLMYAFKDLLNLRSEDDIKSSRVDIEQARKNNEIDLDCEWKKLKPRSVKNHILMNFAMEQAKSRNLNLRDAKILSHLIQLGIQFKQIAADDVDYSDGVIKSIKGVEYNEENNCFFLTNKQGYISHVNNNKTSQGSLDKCIDKWVKDHDKFFHIPTPRPIIIPKNTII